MRSNSGKGESYNNLRDPALKEHEEARRRADRETRRSDPEPAQREGRDR